MSYDYGEVMIYIEINYNPGEKNEDKVRIFGTDFVENNKDKCNIIYEDKEYKLAEYFEEIDNNYNHKDLIKIKLKINNNDINMRCIFCECNSLISFSDILYLHYPNISNTNSQISENDIIRNSVDENDSNNLEKSDIFNQNNYPMIPQSNISKISKKSEINLTNMSGSSSKDFLQPFLNNFKLNVNSLMFYGCNSLISLVHY